MTEIPQYRKEHGSSGVVDEPYPLQTLPHLLRYYEILFIRSVALRETNGGGQGGGHGSGRLKARTMNAAIAWRLTAVSGQ
jgi:hypothetical protein